MKQKYDNNDGGLSRNDLPPTDAEATATGGRYVPAPQSVPSTHLPQRNPPAHQPADSEKPAQPSSAAPPPTKTRPQAVYRKPSAGRLSTGKGFFLEMARYVDIVGINCM
ncbi:uncharacterized protein J8A68_005118 [[Candida] subhashii]|uniref:Uncharacterized protein n=1 Tax=[Candida] subhashii TaxID=561895 RepID=A0A8J5QHN9_9ASCO|nr:uncharacterized protein J8A68_005118 [[Candida] subhashii]KAG7661327.1 hypothetical protein J8A68_005118 [[Candida] subhashii]